MIQAWSRWHPTHRPKKLTPSRRRIEKFWKSKKNRRLFSSKMFYSSQNLKIFENTYFSTWRTTKEILRNLIGAFFSHWRRWLVTGTIQLKWIEFLLLYFLDAKFIYFLTKKLFYEKLRLWILGGFCAACGKYRLAGFGRRAIFTKQKVT